MRGPLIVLLLSVCFNTFAIKGGEAVQIGGIKQWIQFEGPDTDAPILLFLHGGPGNSVISYSDKFTQRLKKKFLVVFWDQRESGQTALLNTTDKPLTVSLFVDDAIEVIQFLQKKFLKGKIYLIGHSWGGYLGFQVAIRRPELIHVYFAMSPMINQLRSEQLALEKMMEKASSENDLQAIVELECVKIPFENGLQLFYHRKWLSKLQGSNVPGQSMVESWARTWLNLFNEASRTSFLVYAPEIKCPVFFLIGNRDYQTNYALAEEYYNQLICPNKKFIWFRNSSHSPNMTETTKFEATILNVLEEE